MRTCYQLGNDYIGEVLRLATDDELKAHARARNVGITQRFVTVQTSI